MLFTQREEGTSGKAQGSLPGKPPLVLHTHSSTGLGGTRGKGGKSNLKMSNLMSLLKKSPVEQSLCNTNLNTIISKSTSNLLRLFCHQVRFSLQLNNQFLQPVFVARIPHPIETFAVSILYYVGILWTVPRLSFTTVFRREKN